MDRAFSDLLKGYRLAAGLAQAALAERANLGVCSTQTFERGESWPLRGPARRLAGVLALPDRERVRFLAAGTRTNHRSAPAGATASTPLEPPSPPPMLLPDLTSFVGRGREIAEVITLLASARLLTLTRTGGISKTRLALRMATQWVDRFADDVRLVELAPLADPTRIPAAVLVEVGLGEQPGRPPLETLRESLLPWRTRLAAKQHKPLLGVTLEASWVAREMGMVRRRPIWSRSWSWRLQR